MSRVAAIDIGSNTLILLIADGDRQGGLTIVRDHAKITRLSEGLKPGGSFLPAAMDRTVAVLKDFRRKCDALKVDRIVAAGTAAFRKAADPKPFIDRVRRECGIEIKIISGDEEARLSYDSVVRDFGAIYKNVAALDIGGGSTELILGPDSRVSLPLGTVALKEELLRHNPPRDEELVKLRDEIRKVLKNSGTREGGAGRKAPAAVPAVSGAGGKPSGDRTPRVEFFKTSRLSLVALAGTCTTLAAVDQQMVPYDPEKVQGYILTAVRLKRLIATFRPLEVEAIKKLPGMDPGRADTILAGSMILDTVMHFLETDQTVISDRGVRYGLWYQCI